jgi:hypothetical protein
MQGIYTHIPETNHVPRGYIVTAILSLLFMVPLFLVPGLALLFLYVSTFQSMCAVTNMAVFCSSLTSWFPGMSLTYFLNDLEMVPVAPIITGITLLLLLLLLLLLKGKDGKVQPRTGHHVQEGEKGYSSTLSLTSALYGVSGQRHAPASLPTGKTYYPLYRRLGGSQDRSGRVRKISPPSRFDPRTVQPVASRYTD